MNNDYPISPRTRSELLVDARFAAATDRTLNVLVKNAERQRLKDQGKFLEELVLDRERDLRYRHRRDPYDSGESGYSSVSMRRRNRVRTQRIYERMRNNERMQQERKEREQKEEEKREMDAIFHTLLDEDDDMFDSNDYEFRLPDFMNFDEIKRGFDEQMKREKEEREEAQRKAAAAKEEKNKPQEKRCLMDHTHLLPNRPRFIAPLVKEENQPKLILDDIDLSLYMSTDEDNDQEEEEQEDLSTSTITERAMKWTINSSEPSTSAGIPSRRRCGWVPPPNLVFIVHDSDSE